MAEAGSTTELTAERTGGITSKSSIDGANTGIKRGGAGKNGEADKVREARLAGFPRSTSALRFQRWHFSEEIVISLEEANATSGPQPNPQKDYRSRQREYRG